MVSVREKNRCILRCSAAHQPVTGGVTTKPASFTNTLTLPVSKSIVYGALAEPTLTLRSGRSLRTSDLQELPSIPTHSGHVDLSAVRFSPSPKPRPRDSRSSRHPTTPTVTTAFRLQNLGFRVFEEFISSWELPSVRLFFSPSLRLLGTSSLTSTESSLGEVLLGLSTLIAFLGVFARGCASWRGRRPDRLEGGTREGDRRKGTAQPRKYCLE
mmetsp:Transcript_28389/g.80134  ORF Transcript_28389/g.80134 Transcript_28389/m.80134 type:complete len:213 (+) Transcript_28389:206-844(+)